MFPASEIKKKKVAQSIVSDIENLGKRAAMAHATPVLSNIKELYFLCNKLAATFAQLEGEGLGADVLGPIVAAEWGFDWADYSDAFDQLKSVAIPAVMTAIVANKAEILARDFGVVGLVDMPISESTQSALKAEIAKVTALISG